jgi:hypothetical protein
MSETYLGKLAEAAFEIYWKEIEKQSYPGVKTILEKSKSSYRLIYIQGFLDGFKVSNQF